MYSIFPDTRPPNILEQPRSNVVFFRPGQQVKLACKAEGYPKPEYVHPFCEISVILNM